MIDYKKMMYNVMLISLVMILIGIVFGIAYAIGGFAGIMNTYEETAPVFTVECRYENNETLIGVYEKVNLYHLPDECSVPVYENGRLKETYSHIALIPTKLSIEKTNSSWNWRDEILAQFDADGHTGIKSSILGKWYVDGVFEYDYLENRFINYIQLSCIVYLIGVVGYIIVAYKRGELKKE